MIGVFTFLSSLIVWTVLKYSVGNRASEEEYDGINVSEFGLYAYTEFVDTGKERNLVFFTHKFGLRLLF